MSLLRQHFPFMATILAMMVLLAIGGHYARGVLDREQELRKAALRAKEDAAWSKSQWSSGYKSTPVRGRLLRRQQEQGASQSGTNTP